MERPGVALTILFLVAATCWAEDKKITVHVDEEQYDALSALAKEGKREVADVIKEAIADYLKAKAPREEAKEEKSSSEDKGGLVTTAKSPHFEASVVKAELVQRIEVVDEYSYQDGAKYKTIESPPKAAFLKVDLDVNTFVWKKMQSLSGDGLVPGCILKWKNVMLEDKDKRSYPCILMGGRDSKPWPPDSSRELILVKRDDGSIRMMRRSQGWRLWSNGEKLCVYFKIPEESGPYKLKFMDVPDLDVRLD